MNISKFEDRRTLMYRNADYLDGMSEVSPENWARWLTNRDRWYNECKSSIEYWVRHYATRTGTNEDDLRGAAHSVFCVACLMYDPSMGASINTYVSRQLGRIHTVVDASAKVAANEMSSIVPGADGEMVDILDTIGAPTVNNELKDYIDSAEPDVQKLVAILMAEQDNSARMYMKSASIAHRYMSPQTRNRLKNVYSCYKRGTEYKGTATLKRKG